MPSTRAALGIAIAVLGASFAGIRAQSPKPSDGTAVIVGHVFGQNGEPLLGAEVWATAPDTPDVVVRRARTDGEGMFVLSRLASNALTVRARAPGLTTASVDTWTIANTPQIAVDLRLWEARTLRGRILDPDGKPIAGASVIATKDFAHFSFVPAEAITDAAGHFELPGVPIGECVLRAIAPGFAFNGHVFDDVIDERCDLLLPQNDGVQLRISAEGLPPTAAAATQVRLQAVAGSDYAMPKLIEQHTLAADGTCVVKGLPETEWRVSLHHPEYRFASAIRVLRCKNPDPMRFLVIPGETTVLTGRVFADDEPLAGQTIHLHTGSSITSIAPQRATTDAEGWFEFTARIRAGDPFHLELAGDQWVFEQTKPRGTTGSHDLRFLGRHEDVARPGVDLELTAVRSTPLRGRVVDPRGYPVPFVSVELQQGVRDIRSLTSLVWRTMLRTTSGSDGSFTFVGVLPSTFALRLRAIGASAIGITEPFQMEEGLVVEKTITTAPTGRVEGSLADADGEPLAGWCMQLTGNGDLWVREADVWVMTDHLGRFVFPGLAPGNYRLRAMRGGRAVSDGPDEFEVREGETVRRELTWQ